MKTHKYTVAIGLNGHREVLAGYWMPEKQGLESHGSLFLEATEKKPDWAEKLETVEIEYEEDENTESEKKLYKVSGDALGSGTFLDFKTASDILESMGYRREDLFIGKKKNTFFLRTQIAFIEEIEIPKQK